MFPALGWAALQADEVVPYVTWAALSWLDPEGSGRIPRGEATRFLQEWRQVDPSSARRLIRSGIQKGYWAAGRGRDGESYLYPTSSAKLLLRFRLDRERAPHLVPLQLLRTKTAMAAHLYATVHEIPGHSQRFKAGPLARSVKADVTGVPPTTQRRYDKYATELVQQVYARVDRRDGDRVGLVGHGYFIGRGGQQWRRLGDYRVPLGHVRASKSAANHALRKARALREQGPGSASLPLASSRGYSSAGPGPGSRRFFRGRSLTEARKHSVDRGGKPNGSVLAWGPSGSMKFVIVEEGL